jgi:hypothetical protein
VTSLLGCAAVPVAAVPVAAVPATKDSVIDGYVHAVCLSASPVENATRIIRTWDETLRMRTGDTVQVRGAQTVGAGIELDYNPPDPGRLLAANSGDDISPSDVRLDSVQDLLYVRTDALAVLGKESVTWLFEYDLPRRHRLAQLRVAPAMLPPQCPDKPFVATRATEGGSLFRLRTYMGGNDPNPTYIIDVDTDGTVHYRGLADVCLRGEASARLSPEAIATIRRLLRETEAMDPSTDRCRRPFVDESMTTVRIAESVPPRTLGNRGLCRSVIQLAQALQEIVGVDRWIGTEEQRKTLPGWQSGAGWLCKGAGPVPSSAGVK